MAAGARDDSLIQRLAATYEMRLRWQALASERQELEVWECVSTKPQGREGHRMEYAYLPPRLSQSEAIQEAALMDERYERAFLRSVREFWNQRLVFASLVVAGGQVNITEGPQQINNEG